MSITRADLELILIRRLGTLLTEAGLDGTTDTGDNEDLNDPIGWAIRQTGGSVASLVGVADSDVSTVSTEYQDKLLDLAEYRTLETISNALTSVEITVGPRSEKLNQLAERVDTKLNRKRTQIQTDYGFGLGSFQAGVVALDFMQKNDLD